MILALVMALLIPGMGALHAIEEPTDSVADVARYYPQSTVFFGVTRIDEAFVDTLDDLVSGLSSTLASLDVPPLTLRQILFFTGGVNPDQLLPLLGDTASIGVTGMDASGTIDADGLQIVVELEDADAALAYILEEYEGMAEVIQNPNATVVAVPAADILFEVYDEVLVIAVEQQTLPGAENSLLNAERFRNTLADLPEDSYNALIYADVPLLAALGDDMDGAELLEQAGPLAIGATILNDASLTIDIAQQLPNLPEGYLSAEPVSQDFLRFVPANTTALIHSTNLSAAIDGLFDLADSQAPNEPSSRVEIEAALAQVGIDLQADILDWTVGEYALFLQADTRAIVNDLAANQLVLEDRFDFGVVIEATDPATAQDLANRLGELLLQASAENPDQNVTITADTLAGLDVTAISITTGIEDGFPVTATPVTIELVLGASEDVFFLTTRSAAESIANGAGSLADSEVYQRAAQTFVNDPLFVAYTDGEGFFTAVAPFPALFFLGTTTSTVFTTVIETIDGTPAAISTPTPIPTPTPDPAVQQQVIDTLEAAYALVDHSSITATVNENSALQVRLVLSLNP
jgi:hypothetical protein